MIFDFINASGNKQNEGISMQDTVIKDEIKLYEKIIDEVAPFLNEEERDNVQIRKIEKGNSTARNYAVLIGNIPRYFVKVYDKKVKLLSKLHQLSKQNNFLVVPIVDFPVGSKRCMVTEWLNGEDISCTPSEAHQVAEMLKIIHSHTAVKHHKSHIKVELMRYLLYLTVNKVQFMHKKEIIAYLLKNSALCRKECCLTHMDVHRRNFIIDSNGIVYLVDYENLSMTDPWRDFVYACFFHNKEEDLFWEAVINNYFNNDIPEDFWITMKYYCHLHLLRMIICEHQKGNYERIGMLAKDIWEKWNCNNSNLPKRKTL